APSPRPPTWRPRSRRCTRASPTPNSLAVSASARSGSARCVARLVSFVAQRPPTFNTGTTEPSGNLGLGSDRVSCGLVRGPDLFRPPVREQRVDIVSIALVTGSAGLIGSEAVRHFAGLGLTVVGIDNDMRRYFFGEDGSTAWSLLRLTSELGDAYMHYDV